MWSEQSYLLLDVLLFPILKSSKLTSLHLEHNYELLVGQVCFFVCSLDASWEFALQLRVRQLCCRWVLEADEWVLLNVFCWVISFQSLEMLFVNPLLWVRVVPNRELHLEQWGLLRWVYLNNMDWILSATVLEGLDVLGAFAICTSNLEFIGWSSDPNECIVVAVQDVNILIKQTLLSECWNLLHI